MRSDKLVNGKGGSVAAVVIGAVLVFAAARAHAGSLTPPAGGPDAAAGAMFTIQDVYNRLLSGTAGTKRGASFVNPTNIGATMKSLDEVMQAAPVVSANGAAATDVCTDKEFFSLLSGAGVWGGTWSSGVWSSGRKGTGPCAPLFLTAFGPFSINENVAAGNVGTPVTATGSGAAYSIEGEYDDGVLRTSSYRFAINGSTGQISRTATGTIDYETNRSYLLKIRATIGGATRDTFVTVNVNDLNDEKPVFLAKGPFSIAENSAVDTVVGTVIATDADGSTLTYSIDAGNTGNAFKIDAATGQVSVGTAALNTETLSGFTLTVKASDGTVANDTTATVDISVTNVNEPPVVVNHAFTVAQGTTKVLTASLLSGTDPESDPATKLTYTVTVLPTKGTLEVESPAGTWNTVNLQVFFSQDDIANARVRYVHTDATKNDDTVNFTLKDSGGASVSATLDITVN